MKVFGVGLSRTGTTSLTKALRMLGYRTVHFPTSDEQIAGHDAATDASVAYRFEELDRAYPGSKFILTVRDEAAWLRSYHQFRDQQIKIGRNWPMNREARAVRRAVYGTEEFDAELWRAGFRRHNERVLHYFAERPGDLLVMDVTRGEGWEKLCPFLGKPIPGAAFPFANKSSRLLRMLPQGFKQALRTPYVVVAQAYDYLVQRVQALR